MLRVAILHSRELYLRPKSLAIFSLRQPDNPKEDLAKRARIEMTDFPDNALDR